MQIIDIIDKNKSVVVLSSYRTGSTAFCDLIANNIGAINLLEFFHPANLSQGYNEIWQLRSSKIVVKIQPDHLDHVGMYWNELFQNSTIIGLFRRNVLEQIASYYVCHMVDRWHETKDIVQNLDYTVAIDPDQISNAAKYILDMNLRLSKIENLMQHKMYYEDIESTLSTSNFVRFQKPTNYDEVKKLVQRHL